MARPPFSPPRVSHLPLVFLVVVVTTTSTTAAPLYQLCPASAGIYTANSTFQSNLNSLLSSLAANGSATGFLNVTSGEIPDLVYGLVLCRGDADTGSCRTCLDTAAVDIQQSCPYKKSAFIWYDNCRLHYSNQRFFSADDDSFKVYLWNAGDQLTEVAQFNRQRDQMMAGLVRYAAYNRSARMFATGEAGYVDAANPKIYGLVQCTRDLTPDGCNTCLRGILSDGKRLLPPRTRGARVLKDTCNFRYELYLFYNISAMVSVPLQTNATAPTPAVQPPTATPATHGEKKNNNRTGTVLAIAIPLGVAFVVICVTCVCCCRKKSKVKKNYVRDTQEINTIESLLFDLATLRAATGNFADLHKLGQGGFGSVYKGLLSDGQEIAVKRLSAGSGQGVEELKNEVVLLAKLQHRNHVRVLGVCLEGEEKLLVYEYVPNRSLDTFLFDPSRAEQLNWERRYKIINGIARGLQYLHEESQLKIIHRDLKASNILLDADMNPKISDFGLARLFGGDQSQASTTRVVGTFGYMAPEYAMRGHFSNKSDVFSFGVLVLEIVTGQRNSDFSGSGNSIDLLSGVWERWRNGTVLEMIDPSLGGQYQRNQLMRCIQIGLLCVQEAPVDRPTMTSVVLVLSSYSVSLQVPSRPAFCIGFSQHDSDVLHKRNVKHSSTSTAHEESTSKSVPYSPDQVSITVAEPR